ncbi:anthranilate phosphoribosyltransferase [Alicyclobacillus contaminans]|uniref:anthranilate phosphoribosyltransferase n=1 Tax=Alicyclobacillus contaminans TaxID=392016 RepID=UPI0004179627|nr:anthranilate phosphoribosyltransferase [Alicyclobacillus contaminans]GMA48688.1 anthranilate phosphoribosyltransferase [Alicyclobacillus contaminans]
MQIRDVLQDVAHGRVLSTDSAEFFMDALMNGDVTPVQTAGFLGALTVRGATTQEIVGFARAMRRNAVRIHPPFPVLDTCGTGGDGANTFNISTASALVCAAAGVKVAKHGNRAVSSRSGSADVLAALGVQIQLSASQALQCLERANVAFLFAQNFHPAMKYAAEPRKQLGFRTVFNILGPLTNPAGAVYQVLGVYRDDLVRTVAEVLLELGTEHALVVHGAGGVDEFSLQGETHVAEVRNGRVVEYAIRPEDVGLAAAPLAALEGGDGQENAEILRCILSGSETGPRRDVVSLNAGAGLYAANAVPTLAEGVRTAESLLASGAAARALDALVQVSNQAAAVEVVQ